MGHVEQLEAAIDRVARAVGMPAPDVRDLVRACGWPDHPFDCGVSHGTPWGVSMAIGEREVRVFLAARDRVHADAITRSMGDWELPPGIRVWHAVAFTPSGRRDHVYACADLGVPRPPALPTRARITMTSRDLPSGRKKVYALIPDCTIAELAAIDREGAEFARALIGDRTIWWLVCFHDNGAIATHFFVPRHLDEPALRTRLRAFLVERGLDPAPWETLPDAHHYVTYQRRDGKPRVTAYFLP